MAYRTRIKYTYAQKQEIWDRWKKGESLTSIGKELYDLRAYERSSSMSFRTFNCFPSAYSEPFKIKS